jgi:hypothetical protein
MYHNCENDSRTIGEFYNTIKDEQLMQMLSLVSCCVRPEDALNFITRTIHTVNYDGRIWPEHRFDTLLDPLKEVWVLYKIHCKLNSVLWSMEGLDHFASSHRKYRTTIDDILYDYESDRIRYYAIR